MRRVCFKGVSAHESINMPYRQKQQAGQCAGVEEEGRGKKQGRRARRVLWAESSPSQDTAGGAGFRVVRWPNLSLAMLPTGAGLSERSWTWKKPQDPSSRVVTTQKIVQRTIKPHPSQAGWFPALPGGGWLGTQPVPCP